MDQSWKAMALTMGCHAREGNLTLLCIMPGMVRVWLQSHIAGFILKACCLSGGNGLFHGLALTSCLRSGAEPKVEPKPVTFHFSTMDPSKVSVSGTENTFYFTLNYPSDLLCVMRMPHTVFCFYLKHSSFLYLMLILLTRMLLVNADSKVKQRIPEPANAAVDTYVAKRNGKTQVGSSFGIELLDYSQSCQFINLACLSAKAEKINQGAVSYWWCTDPYYRVSVWK